MEQTIEVLSVKLQVPVVIVLQMKHDVTKFFIGVINFICSYLINLALIHFALTRCPPPWHILALTVSLLLVLFSAAILTRVLKPLSKRVRVALPVIGVILCNHLAKREVRKQIQEWEEEDEDN